MADPIVTITKAPSTGLVFSVHAEEARKQITRNLGRYKATYLNGDVTTRVLDLTRGQITHCDTEKWKGGMVKTSAPIIFRGAKLDPGTGALKETEINVSSLLVVDDSFDFFTIEVPASTEHAIVSLHYVGNPPLDVPAPVTP